MTALKNKAFYRTLMILVAPLALQNLLNAAVSSADVLMLSYVSQTALAAGSLAGQIIFILNLFFTGVSSGMIMLSAQYWGKGDIKAIEHILSIGLKISLAVSALFAAAAFFMPKVLMRIFTNDAQLIENGAVYLKIVSLSYMMMGISQVYLAAIKSMEKVKTSTLISSSALVLNIGLNAVFIFGVFGLPKMGIAGIALATTIARTIELLLCILHAYKAKILRFHPAMLFERHPALFSDFIKYSAPALGNEFLWGIAFSMYSVIMGHLGEDVVAANSVVTVARNLCAVVCFGVAGGGAILLGKEIGTGNMEKAKKYASLLNRSALAAGVIAGVILIAIQPVIFSVTTLTPTAQHYLKMMIYMNSVYILGQTFNTCMICGTFRAGGDSRFGFICDVVVMWGIAVPVGFLCAFVFKLPVMAVYGVLCLDEFIKIPAVYKHYKSYKWLNDITR